MVVQNIQELYLLIIAFQFYEMIWFICVETGLIAIPFIYLFWDSGFDEYRKFGSVKGADSSQRKLAFDIVTATLVMVLFYTPFVELGISDFRVQRLVNPELTSESLSRNEERVRDGFSDNTIQVPIFFSFFYNLFNGVMYSGVEGVNQIGGNLADLRELESLIYLAKIQDPILNNEVRRFTNECYIPAKSKYERLYSSDPAPFMADILEKSPGDLNWIGSRILTTTQGLYARCETASTCGDGSAGFQAHNAVKGFSYDESRDQIYLDGQAHPYCNEWWSEELRPKLIDYAREIRSCMDYGSDFSKHTKYDDNCNLDNWWAAMTDHFGAILSDIFGESELTINAEDYALRHFLRNTNEAMFVPSPYAVADDTYSGELMTEVRNAVGFIGSGKKLIETQTKMQAVKVALPSIQTVLIFIVIIILPFYAIVSMLKLEKAFIPLIALAFIKILAIWWSLVSVIDNKALELMGVGSMWSALFDPINSGNFENSVTVYMWNIIVLAMYFGVPLVGGAILQKANDAANAVSSMGGQGVHGAGGGAANEAGNEASSTEGQSYQGVKKAATRR